MDETINLMNRYAYAVGWLSGSITTLLNHRDENGNIPTESVEDVLRNLQTLKDNVGDGILTKELEEVLR